MATRTRRTATATRTFADFERTDEGIEAVAEQLVDLADHAAEFRAVEVALHQRDHVFDQQVALHLHDRGGVGADEQHDEVVAGFLFGFAFFLVVVGVVERDFDGRALLGQLVERHAHFVEFLAEVFVTRHGPAHREHVLLLVEADAGLFLVGTGGAIGK